MKEKSIEELNYHDLFDGDNNVGRENVSVGELVNKEVQGTVIQVQSKTLKNTRTTYDVSLIYEGLFVKINYTEQLIGDNLSYKINSLESELDLTEQEKKDILTFVIYQ